jgi:hypothetical protein
MAPGFVSSGEPIAQADTANSKDAQLEAAAQRATSAADLGRPPLLEHRSVAAQPSKETAQPAQSAQRAEEGSAQSLGHKLVFAVSALKDWSDQDWQIAVKAVEEHRWAAKAQTAIPDAKGSAAQQATKAPLAEHRSAADTPPVWQPPEEIARKASGDTAVSAPKR